MQEALVMRKQSFNGNQSPTSELMDHNGTWSGFILAFGSNFTNTPIITNSKPFNNRKQLDQ